MTLVCIFPGRIGVASEAIDLFGAKRVIPSPWGTPVWVQNLSDEETDFAREFFRELKCKVVIEKIRFSVKTSIHNQPCIEASGLSTLLSGIIKLALFENRMNQEAYRLRTEAGAFLQGQDEASGWVLVEFWGKEYQPWIDYVNRLISQINAGGHV